MRQKLFKGFSTVEVSGTGPTNYRLYDLELVKRDLLNHFHTFKGERVMMPEYGSIVWDVLMDPLTDSLIEIIVDDCKRIIQSDSRVAMEQIDVREFDHGLIINFVLYFKPWDVYENFSVEFDRRILQTEEIQ